MSLPILPADSAFKKQKDEDHETASLEKGDVIAAEELTQNAGEYASLHIPWKWKWFALALTCALPIGQTWTDAALGPLKSTLRTELGINNTQYGVIDSAGSIINSIWPLLGGMCLDWFGVSTVSLICTSTIFIGSIIAALAANTGIWRMLVGGHIMMGFGTAVLDSAQHKLFYHFFGAQGLALAFGLESAIAKTMSLAAGMSTIPIKEATGWYGWAFWIPVVLCGFSLLVNIGYVIWSKTYLPREFRLTGAREQVLPENRKARFSFTTVMFLPWAFWMLPCTQLFQSEAAGAFGNSATDLIEMRGFTTAVAAFTANAKNILPIILSPVVGFLCDRFGYRFHLTALAPILWITACAVIGWSSVHPLLPVVISSLAGVINAFPFQICIPLLLRDQSKLGTAFGVWRCFNNSGSTIMSIIYGIVQDRTDNMGYSNVLIIGIAFKALAFLLGLGYILIDYKYLGRGMTMGEKERVGREAEIENADDDPLTRRTISKKVSIVGLTLLGGMVVSAWTVFIKYVL